MRYRISIMLYYVTAFPYYVSRDTYNAFKWAVRKWK